MNRSIVILGCLFSFASSPLLAGTAAPTLTFLNSDHPAIPLNPAEPVTVTAEGNITTTCVFQTSNPRLCEGLGTGVNGNAPTVALGTNLNLVAGSTDTYQVASGQQFQVTRTIGNTADVCLTSATNLTQVTGWTAVAPTSGTSSVTVSAPAGPFSLGLRCYNEAGAAETTELKLQVTAPVGPDPNACILREQGNTDPLLQPSNFTRHVRTWPQVFNGSVFPNTPSSAMPVGSYTVTLDQGTSPPSAGMYLSIPVTLPVNHRLRILTTYPTGGFPSNYLLPRSGNVFISLSPCAGDLRPTSPSAPDIYGRACRGLLGESTLTFSTRAGVGSCSVPAGNYWINIMHADPSVPNFGPTFETCNPLTTQDPTAKCESNLSIDYIPI